jgi:hypothetical protein
LGYAPKTSHREKQVVSQLTRKLRHAQSGPFGTTAAKETPETPKKKSMKKPNRILPLAALIVLTSSGLIAQTSGSTTGGTTTTSGTGTTSSGTTSGGTTTTSGGTTTTSGGTTTTSGGTTGGTTTTTTGDDHDGHGKPAAGSTGGTTTGTGGDHGKAAPHTPDDHASDNAKAVQTILQKFDANRDQFMAERQALLDKLQAAKTDAERQVILDQLRAEQQTEKDQRKQLGKEIRDQLKTLREQRKGGG